MHFLTFSDFFRLLRCPWLFGFPAFQAPGNSKTSAFNFLTSANISNKIQRKNTPVEILWLCPIYFGCQRLPDFPVGPGPRQPLKISLQRQILLKFRTKSSVQTLLALFSCFFYELFYFNDTLSDFSEEFSFSTWFIRAFENSSTSRAVQTPQNP